MVALSDYTNREQSYVKHVFLEGYLERLVHKTASVYPHIVYVDGCRIRGPSRSGLSGSSNNDPLQPPNAEQVSAILRSKPDIQVRKPVSGAYRTGLRHGETEIGK